MPDRLLTAIPPSGEYLERRFDVSARANTWVLFEPPGAVPWVGVFGNPGIADYSDLVHFPHDANLVLIIAGARGYVIDRRSGVLLRQTRRDYCYAALPVPGSNRIVLADNTLVWCTSPTEDVYARVDSPLLEPNDLNRIGLDGIVFLEVNPARLLGTYESYDGWFSFTLEFSSMLVRRGPRVPKGQPGSLAESGRGYPPTRLAIERAHSFRIHG